MFMKKVFAILFEAKKKYICHYIWGTAGTLLKWNEIDFLWIRRGEAWGRRHVSTPKNQSDVQSMQNWSGFSEWKQKDGIFHSEV